MIYTVEGSGTAETPGWKVVDESGSTWERCHSYDEAIETAQRLHQESEVREWVLEELEQIVIQGSHQFEVLGGPSASAQNEMRDLIRQVVDEGGY